MKKQSEGIHYWLISPPAPGGHEIGVCKYCGERKDFTELQTKNRNFRELLWAESLVTRKATMESIMASLNGGKKHRRSKGRKRASKGILNE